MLKNLNKVLTDTKLALALANDYKNIYCVDTRDDSYIEYERDGTDHDFVIVNKGSDFFTDSIRDCRLKIYEEDQDKFLDMFDKNSFMQRINIGRSFNFDYRIMINGVPTYYHLKTIKGTDENEGLVFIGVTDVDKLKRREMAANEERMRFARISNALASRYELLYYINTVTGEYTAYTSNDKYAELKSSEHGNDFFGDAPKNTELIAHPDDVEMIKNHLN